MSNTLVYKNVMAEIKNKDITVGQLNRLKRAIIEIGNKPIPVAGSNRKSCSFCCKGTKDVYVSTESQRKNYL